MRYLPYVSLHVVPLKDNKHFISYMLIFPRSIFSIKIVIECLSANMKHLAIKANLLLISAVICLNNNEL